MIDLGSDMQKLLVIEGPTGTGKTNLALVLAKKFNGEIVSADSRQVYIGMDIGTGKEVAGNELRVKSEKGKWFVNDIPIYLYDIVNPDQRFSLADYQQLALEKIEEIHRRNKLPLLVGGTGLYIQAVTEGLKIPKAPPDQKLREELENRSLEDLLIELEKIDQTTFKKIDKSNKRRVVHALEVFYQTGQPFSSLRRKYKIDFDVLKIGLTGEREKLYEKVDKRVEEWFRVGFIDEVETLFKKYPQDLPSMTSIGYRQTVAFLTNKLDLETAKQRTKYDVHGYIRRQLTWFRRDQGIVWFNIFEPDFLHEIEDSVKNWLLV